MKRWLSVLVVFSCIIALFGCENGTIKGQVYFNAQVLEVNKGYIKVRCVETFNSGISVDEEFSVTTDVVSNSEVPELNVDDNIRVVFNGEIMESYPIQLGTIYAIYLLDENGEVKQFFQDFCEKHFDVLNVSNNIELKNLEKEIATSPFNILDCCFFSITIGTPSFIAAITAGAIPELSIVKTFVIPLSLK